MFTLSVKVFFLALMLTYFLVSKSKHHSIEIRVDFSMSASQKGWKTSSTRTRAKCLDGEGAGSSMNFVYFFVMYRYADKSTCLRALQSKKDFT